MILSYLIWNADPEILSIGTFALRWYGLLFASGFLITQQILYYIYRKEGKPEKDVETLTIYMVVATVVGARLGHILFYQPETIWTNPLSIILPFEYSPHFRFTGYQGLASHGAAFGILFGLWLYSRKKKPGQNYLQVLDRIVILVALAGALIRIGNFFNSEIIGKPTASAIGVVFVNRVTESLVDPKGKGPVESVTYKKDEPEPTSADGLRPITIYLFFKSGTTEVEAREFLTRNVKSYLSQLDEFVFERAGPPLRYEIVQEKDGIFGARVKTLGIARHPAQLYEAFSCILLFAFLFWLWSRDKLNLPSGRILGWFLVILWSLRFLFEFFKKSQVDFEDKMAINMGQILSIPLFIAGIIVLFYSYKNSPKGTENPDLGKIS